MSRKPILWKEDEYKARDRELVAQGYSTCIRGTCANLAAPGEECPQHKVKFPLERAPRNILSF
jgi:hypothetical protein